MKRDIVSGIDIITETIAQKAEEESALILKQAKAQAAAISAEYEEKAKAILLSAKEKAKKESALSYERALSASANHKRNLLLFKKGALVEEAFEKALKELESLGTDDYVRLLSNLLERVLDAFFAAERRSCAYEGDSFVKETKLSLVMAKRDESYGKALVESVSKKLAAEGKVLTLGQADLTLDSGFVLIAGDIRMDSSLKRLISSQKASLEGAVFSILFA